MIREHTKNEICLMRTILQHYQRLCRAEGAQLRSIEHRGRHYAQHFDGGFVIPPAPLLITDLIATCAPPSVASALEGS